MATFRYKAVTPEGEVLQGSLEGPSREWVVRELQGQGQVPIRIEESARPAAGGTVKARLRLRSGRITQDHIATVTLELSTLLRAGVPLDRALSVLISLADHERLGAVLSGIQERVQGGSSLADALDGAEPGLFTRFYVNLVRAGEAGGALDGVLERLAEHMERAKEVKDFLLSAMIYPTILLGVAVLSIFILLGYVVPQFSELFEGAGQVLPLPTRITIAAGDLLRHWGWTLPIIVIVAVWWMRRQLADRAGRYRWDAWFLRLPVAGPIIAKVEVARFARTLGTLLHNGVPLLKAMSIVKDTLVNQVIARGVEDVAGGLKEGHSLAEPLAEVGRFPSFAVHMIRVGEESGHLEEMLMQVAGIYEKETQNALKRALALLEPVMILVLGTVIAGVVMSILVAILGVNELVF